MSVFEIPLTQGRVALVDESDRELVAGFKWGVYRRPSGRNGYVTAPMVRDGRTVRVSLSRFLLGVTDKQSVVDHVNGDTLDNRRCNLRVCTQALNMANRRPSKNNQVGYKGVLRDKTGRYRANISLGGAVRSLGGYATAIEAAVAYDIAAKEQWGEFAWLNFSAERDWFLPVPTRNPKPGVKPTASPPLRFYPADQ